MFFSNMKNAFALVAVAFALTAGVGVWSYIVGTGLAKEKRQQQPQPAKLEPAKTVESTTELKRSEEKPQARVGQIFIVGGSETSEKEILGVLDLFPGKVLSFSELHLAEQRLARIAGLKNSPKVTVIDREGNDVFKDICITVEEK